MPSSVPTNTQGALRTYADFTTWLDADGIFHGEDWYQDVIPYRANTTIAAGDAVMFVAPTATVPLSVTPLSTTAGEAYRFVGIAKESATAGQQCDIVVAGVVQVNIGSQTVAFGDMCTSPATGAAGVPTRVAQASVAATHIIGTMIGTYLSANDITGTDKAVVFVNKG